MCYVSEASSRFLRYRNTYKDNRHNGGWKDGLDELPFKLLFNGGRDRIFTARNKSLGQSKVVCHDPVQVHLLSHSKLSLSDRTSLVEANIGGLTCSLGGIADLMVTLKKPARSLLDFVG